MTISHSVRSKMERAKEHIAALDAELAAYRSLNPCHAIKEPDADGGGYTVRFTIDPPIPDRLGLLVGDAAHNMRSALDHLAWALVIGAGNVPDSGTEFAVFVDQAEFNKARARKIGKMSAPAQQEIESLQPYHRGHDATDDPLWITHELDRIDKHRTINVIAGQYRIKPDAGSALYWNDQLVSDPVRYSIIGTLHDGAILGHFGPGDDANKELEPYLSARIAFDFDGPAGGSGLDKMGRIHAYIERDVIPRFEQFFP